MNQPTNSKSRTADRLFVCSNAQEQPGESVCVNIVSTPRVCPLSNLQGSSHHRGLNLQPVQQTPGVTETGTIEQRIPHTHAGQQVPVAETADGCVCVLGRWFCCNCVCVVARGWHRGFCLTALSQDSLRIHKFMQLESQQGVQGPLFTPKHEQLNEAAA